MIDGRPIIGNSYHSESTRTFRATDRHSGELLDGVFFIADEATTGQTVALANKAFRTVRWLPSDQRRAFLQAIAKNLESVRQEIVARAMSETALPEVRLQGELTRTINQILLFADLIETDGWKDMREVSPLPDRTPPRPHLVYEHRPIGPVVVFGASNFPLAFSVAGGDTVSALAAGCPVIVKAHPAHPGTSALAGEAIRAAAESCEMPEGIFSLLYDDGFGVGKQLVQAHGIRGVGFTGSREGGLALKRLIFERETPIPLFAEMSSVNPTVVMPSVVETRAEAFAEALFASCSMGVGQFCTNPGLVFVIGDASVIVAKLKALMEPAPAGVMLTEGIGAAYLKTFAVVASIAGVDTVVKPSEPGKPGLLFTNSEVFRAEATLQSEIFGPALLVVECQSTKDARECFRSMGGQLTASIHGNPHEINNDVRFVLEEIAGRILFNQFPTGVEVCEAMFHGGPFPATFDGRSTSVGTAAIYRWVRPIAAQNWPVTG